MYRSFSNRIFAGLCGGLANRTPLNAWIWRLIFIVLSLLTMGVAAIIYLMMWWLLPLDSPLQNREGGALLGLIGLLLSIALLVMWFGRANFNLSETYWAIASLILAIIFLLKQIVTRRGQNIAIGLVAVAIPTVFLLNHYEVLQTGVIDILLRSAPAILIFLGLSLVLRYRVRFGSWIALLLSIILVAALVSYAYSSRVDVISTDNQIERLIPNEADNDLSEISEAVTTLLITVQTLDTDVTITVSDTARVIQANFVGSNNNRLDIDYAEDGAFASMQLIEFQESDFPLLQDIGRGELTVEIPPDIAVGITFNSASADLVSLDMGELDLERLSFNVPEGNVLVRLPLYQPLSPSFVDSNGEWQVGEGSLRVIAPSELGLRLSFDRSRNAEPSDFDDLIYQLLVEQPDFVLASRQFDNADAQMQFRIDVTGGFSLENADN